MFSQARDSLHSTAIKQQQPIQYSNTKQHKCFRDKHFTKTSYSDLNNKTIYI